MKYPADKLVFDLFVLSIISGCNGASGTQEKLAANNGGESASGAVTRSGSSFSDGQMAAGTRLQPSAVSSVASVSRTPSARPPLPGTEAPPDVAAPPPDAVTTPSGLAWRVLVPGTGKGHPGSNDRAKMNYTGWTRDGRMFDSSLLRHQPATLSIREGGAGGFIGIKGWSEGVQLMVTGEKRRFWIPASLAFGDQPGALTMDVELLEFFPAPKSPPVP